MTDWTTPDDVPADTIDRLHRWLLQEGNPADAATPGERAVADIIRAFWPVPATTLAEELRYRADLLDNGDPDGDTPHALRTLAARAEQIEQERDAARAEVERLTAEVKTLAAENSDLRNSVTVPSVNYSDGLTTCSDATVTSPADVKPGEAWLVELDGQRATALKDNDGLAPWSIVGPDGRCRIGGDTAITLVSRLVPAPRVITTVAELDALPDGTIIQDAEMSVGEKSGNYWDTPGSCCDASSDYFILPVTVLWEPDA